MIDSFHRKLTFGAFVAPILALALWVAPAAAENRPLRIYAAASLVAALPEALDGWSGETLLVHAGSSTLARQIEQGAAADILIAADPDWAYYLRDAGLTEVDPVPLLGNALVAIVPSGAAAGDPAAAVPPFPPGALLAVADVEAVPAGRYARRALQAAGDWPTRARLLETAHVREALAWAARGEVDYAIVYRSDAAAEPRVTVVAEFPEDPAHPIRYVGVAIAGAGPDAQALLTYLKGPRAQAAFARHGFTPLGE